MLGIAPSGNLAQVRQVQKDLEVPIKDKGHRLNSLALGRGESAIAERTR